MSIDISSVQRIYGQSTCIQLKLKKLAWFLFQCAGYYSFCHPSLSFGYHWGSYCLPSALLKNRQPLELPQSLWRPFRQRRIIVTLHHHSRTPPPLLQGTAALSQTRNPFILLYLNDCSESLNGCNLYVHKLSWKRLKKKGRITWKLYLYSIWTRRITNLSPSLSLSPPSLLQSLKSYKV